MKKSFISIILLLIFSGLFAQTLVNQDWVQSGNATPTAMYDSRASHIDASHNLYVVGNTFHSGQQENFVIQKFNSAGVLQWETEYNGTLSGVDYATDITTIGSGIFVTGVEGDTATGVTYITTIELNASGVIQWTNKYTGAFSGYNIPARIIPNAAGTLLYICGTSQTSSADFAMVTLCLSTSGTQQWAARYDSTGFYSGGADLKIVESTIVTYGVCGLSSSSGNFITKSYNLTNGSSLGYTRVNNPNSYITKPIGMVKDNAENIYFTGVVETSPNNTDIKIVKLDSLLNLKWEKVLDGGANGNDEVTGIKLDKNGYVVLTGFAAAADTSKSVWTIRMKDSVLVWNKKYYCSIPHQDAKGASLDLDSLNNIYVTGKIYDGANYDDLTLSYDTSGNLSWQKNYSQMGFTERGQNIIVDSGGFVYVNGESTSGTSNKYTTIQYSQWRPTECAAEMRNSDSTCPTITYIFKNGKVDTYGLDTFVEFDIYARQNKSFGYAGGEILFTYNNSIFGNAVVDSNNITFTRGTITTDTSAYALSLRDTLFKSGAVPSGYSEVNLFISALDTSLFTIADTSQQLCHIKMKIKHKGYFGIGFDEFFMENKSIYSNASINYTYVYTGRFMSLSATSSSVSLVESIRNPTFDRANGTISINVKVYTGSSVPLQGLDANVGWDNGIATYNSFTYPFWVAGNYTDNGGNPTAIGTGPGSGNFDYSVNQPVYANSQETITTDSTGGGDAFISLTLNYTDCGGDPAIALSTPTFASYYDVDSSIQDFSTSVTGGYHGYCTGGIHDIENMNKVNVYPNPFSNSLVIQFNLQETSNVAITLTNLIGQNVYQNNLGYMDIGSSSKDLIIPSELSEGVYILQAKINEQNINLKIIKK